jgi:predicted dehydrogenase
MIRWGIIGCGDVTELKSGPAFNKVPGSELIAVMRRDALKARDYASRHHVPKWYSDANQLIQDPDINAIYVATPPDSHEEYTLNAIEAGKPVYVEKPMALNVAASKRMADASSKNNIKVCVAHYRREQPLFKKIKELVESKAIGNIKYVTLKFLKPALAPDELEVPKTKWRVNPTIAGGGLFHDLAPHQLDLMLYFFGNIKSSCGYAFNQDKLYSADDVVTGSILFQNGIVFTGLWCFTVQENGGTDIVEIQGSKGRIQFGVFDNYNLSLSRNGNNEVLSFEKIQHVQQPMIEKVVQYFSGNAKNPCPPEDGVAVMKIMESFTNVQTT